VHITAAVARQSGQPFTLETLDLADPREHEVLVEIRGVGICHTDVAARDGVYGLPYPSVLGHEGAGVVAAVGSAVTGLAVGDPVALSFGSCGDCRTCTSGSPAYCLQFTENNYIGGRPDGSNALTADGTPVHGHFFSQSSFATHAIAHERNAVKVDTELDVSLLGPLGCGIQTGAGAVMQSMAAREGSTLLVLGAGPVGLAAVMGGVLRGCGSIVVVEPVAARRELARSLGATETVDPLDGALADTLAKVLPQGADYIFDTTGRVEVITAAIGAAAMNAIVGLVGVPSDFSVDLPVNIVGAMQRGLTIKGIVEGDSDPKVFIPELLRYHAEGRFPFDRLITTFPLDRINDAVEAQHRGDVTKVVLVPAV
jgi:aryl-alcohol dehydrogenase